MMWSGSDSRGPSGNVLAVIGVCRRDCHAPRRARNDACEEEQGPERLKRAPLALREQQDAERSSRRHTESSGAVYRQSRAAARGCATGARASDAQLSQARPPLSREPSRDGRALYQSSAALRATSSACVRAAACECHETAFPRPRGSGWRETLRRGGRDRPASRFEDVSTPTGPSCFLRSVLI
jgi:hypothetical protein